MGLREKPSVPVYSAKPKAERTGRDQLNWEFYCKKCNYLYGNVLYAGAKDYTLERLSTYECPECGAIDWDVRTVTD